MILGKTRIEQSIYELNCSYSFYHCDLLEKFVIPEDSINQTIDTNAFSISNVKTNDNFIISIIILLFFCSIILYNWVFFF